MEAQNAAVACTTPVAAGAGATCNAVEEAEARKRQGVFRAQVASDDESAGTGDEEVAAPSCLLTICPNLLRSTSQWSFRYLA